MVFQKGHKPYKKKSFKGENNPFYGKHHTEESKKKMGAKKGSIPWNKDKHGIYTEETLQKMKKAKTDYIPWNKGLQGEEYLKHYPDGKLWCDGLTKDDDERIARYAEKLKGRDFSEDHRKKISESRWGKDNPAWAGGNSFKPYNSMFNRKLKREIAERDSFTCQLCGMKHPSDANVHHWNYDKDETDGFYFVYTCRGCNARLNYNRESWEEYFYKHQVKRGLLPKK